MVVVAVTVLLTFPLPAALVTIVTVAWAPFARVPIEQVTVRLPDA